MDSFKFHDIRVEKANAISKQRRIQKITTLFRFIELFVFLIVLSRLSTQFAFSFKLSVEHFKGISITLISPRSVFILGNAIVIALFLISGQFSGGKDNDFYEEYAERCRNNQQTWIKEERKECRQKVMSRSQSTNLERAARGEDRRRDLRRSTSEKYRKSVDCGKKAAVEGGGGCSYVEEEMSSEEFRRTVEAFIARQQKSLREEEDISAVVSFET